MADAKISDLSLLPAASIDTADLLPIVDTSANETKRTQVSDLDSRYFTKSTDNTDQVTEGSSNLYHTTERAQDAVGAALVNSGIVPLSHNDVSNQISGDLRITNAIAKVAPAPTDEIVLADSADSGNPKRVLVSALDSRYQDRANHTGTQLSSTVSDFAEAAQDAVGAALQNTGIVPLSYNDGLGAISGDIDIGQATEDAVTQNDSLFLYKKGSNHRRVTKKDLLSPMTDILYSFSDDFLFNAPIGMTTTAAGTSASGQVGNYGIPGTQALGVWQLDTGTTATGRATSHTNIASIGSDGFYLELCGRLALEQFSTSLERFAVSFGFMDNNGAESGSIHTDGMFFYYQDNIGSGNWQCYVVSNSTATVVDSGVAANTLYNTFKIIKNEGSTSVKFLINGTQVADIATNIPTGGSRLYGYGAKIEKKVGLTQANLSLDYIEFLLSRSVAR